jgi:glycosyltransferase involved in cell wall biosynthesis
LPLAGLAGGIAARLARCRFLITSRRHRNERLKRYPVRGALERFVNRRAQAVTANSLRVARDLASEGVERGRIALIHNGVDAESFSRTARAPARMDLGLRPDALVIVIVANLVVHKGHADVFSALEMMHQNLKGDWRLLLAGRDDGMERQLRDAAKRGGFADHVDFLGEQENVAPLLAAADFGILASHEEGFSNALLEAMAAGLPMIVTDVGGNPEAIVDEDCGLVVPARAPDRMGGAIMRLASDPALRRRYGGAAAGRARALFTLERAAEKQAALYRALISGEGVPQELRAPPKGSA